MIFIFKYFLYNTKNDIFYSPCPSYHVFEGVLNGSNHQTLMGDFLLGEKACGRGVGGTRSAGGPPKRSGPGEGTVGCGGEEMIDGLLLQASWRRQVGCAEDLHYLLEVQGDVVMEEAGGDDGCPGTSVAIEQCPVVKGEIFRAILQETDVF